MSNGKASTRVNGKNGENIWIENDELGFKTGGSVEHMPKEVVSEIAIMNIEEARDAVNKSDLIPHGSWTKEMPSSGGKTMFLVVKGRASIWVMEITKNQVPNASSFADGVVPKSDSDENKRAIPNRVINTPLGALFTVGSIVCLILATFLVFTWNQPILGLISAIASILMYINIK